MYGRKAPWSGIDRTPMAESSTHLQYIQEKLGRRVLDTLVFRGDDILILDRAGLRESFRFFKEDARLRFDFLSDITAVDYWKKQEPRFEVVYQVVSLKGGRRLRVRVPAGRRCHGGVFNAALAGSKFSRTGSLGLIRYPLYRSSGFAAGFAL